MIEKGLEGGGGGGGRWPHKFGGFVPAHRLRAGCRGLIVNQGHPVQIYVPLRAIWDLLS